MVRLLAALAAVTLALPAAAQLTDPASPLPGGLNLPLLGVAAADEATAASLTPAGAGFVGAPSLHYFHQEAAESGRQERADGLYLAGLLGHLGPSLAMEWVRPDDGVGQRYRRTTLGLTLSDGRLASLGVAWRWWSSPDPVVEALQSWDLGLTLRPTRWLSVAGSALGLDARLAGQRVPTRYDVGLALKPLGDRLILAGDVLADDADGQPFRSTHATAGLQVEVGAGFSVLGQVRLPLPDAPSGQREPAGVVTLTWNTPRAGVTGGAAFGEAGSDMLIGTRGSAEKYRAPAVLAEAARLDVAKELQPQRLLFLTLGERDRYGALLRKLELAREDAEVRAVLLEVDGLPLGAGRVEELRAAIARLRQVKPVLVYLTGGGTREYWLASAATAVAVPPGATLVVNGVARTQLYLKDGLARLGVAVEVAKAGAWKSAPEPLTRTGPSDEARAMMGALLDDVTGRLRADVAASRKLAPEKVAALVDQGLFSAPEAKAAGLVDELLWPDELERWTWRTARVSGRMVDGWSPAPKRLADRWGPTPAIAVVRLEGTIAGGRSRGEPLGDGGIAGADTVVDAIEAAAKDARVRAIVLRVESPGGDASASDLIWRALMQAKQKKPVVVSMGDVAASGGYLAAVGADYIVAEPSTLTGSIGVFMLKPDLSGMLEKLSVTRDTQQRGKLASVDSLWKPWSAEERAAVEKQVEVTYRGFLAKVAEGRKLPPAEVEAVAGGRVWTGAQALERRLVDRLGGLSDAVAVARERAGIHAADELELTWLGGRERFDLSSPLDSTAALLADAGPPSQVSRLAARVPELRTAALLLELGPMLALPLEWLEAPPPAAP